MQLANFNKKEVRVKSFTRKGRVVRAYSRLQKALVKRKKDGDVELTPLSKGLLVAGGVTTLALGYKNRRLLEKAIDKVRKKVNVDKLSENAVMGVGKPSTKAIGEAMAAPYRNGRDLTPNELKQIRDNIERNLKRDGRLTTTATGDDFFKLRERRDLKNKRNLEMRKRNASGLIGGYKDYKVEDDLFVQIRKSRTADQRKKRKELAKQLRQRLGGNY